jgi:hypothetical protein
LNVFELTADGGTMIFFAAMAVRSPEPVLVQGKFWSKKKIIVPPSAVLFSVF